MRRAPREPRRGEQEHRDADPLVPCVVAELRRARTRDPVMNRPSPKPQKISSAASQCSAMRGAGVAGLRHAPCVTRSLRRTGIAARCTAIIRRVRRSNCPIERHLHIDTSGDLARPAVTRPLRALHRQTAARPASVPFVRVVVGALVFAACRFRPAARRPPPAATEGPAEIAPEDRPRAVRRRRPRHHPHRRAQGAGARCAYRSTTSRRRRWARSSAACTPAACRPPRWRSIVTR